jgi:uncharacterized membrane protein
MTSQITEVATLVIAGWVAGAESASWALVHPVIKRLAPNEQIIFQQGLLKTFGRIMPLLMPLNFILTLVLCVMSANEGNTVFYLRLVAVIALATMILTTIVFNVPVNAATGKWNPADPPPDWERKRARWRFFQAYRSLILIAAFIILVIAQTVSP